MGKRIIVLGVGQNNFLSFLYAKLKRHDPEFVITAPFYRDLNKGVSDETWMYENAQVNNGTSIVSLLKSGFLNLVSLHFYQTLLFILFVEKKLKKAAHFAKSQVQAEAFFIQNNNFAEFDTFHFHYMQYSYLRELFLVPKNKKIVCSFWGSDLLRTSDIMNFYFVKKALQKATIITCQSIELREIILSKFGRNLLDKVYIAKFPLDEKIYQEIDINSTEIEILQSFKLRYGYAIDKINILIGHNGSKSNNHLKIIDALGNLMNKNRLHLIVNLNYAISAKEKPAYKAQLNVALQKLGCSYVILEHFFPKDELALSRLATDAFIHLPISDALSGTMTEMLYASNIVFTGSWLPYKTFRNIGVVYNEVDDFSSLTEKVDLFVNNYAAEKEAVRGNKQLIKEFFFNKDVIYTWSQILN